MRTLERKEGPRRFDSLHTLKVWTPYGNLMVETHEVFNGERCPYTNEQLWTRRDGKPEPYSTEELLASLAKGEAAPLKIVIGRFILEGPVVSATRIGTSVTSWVLVFDGILWRWSGDDKIETTAKLVAYYDTEDGSGFCLLPELARKQLWD